MDALWQFQASINLSLYSFGSWLLLRYAAGIAVVVLLWFGRDATFPRSADLVEMALGYLR
jgi:hypothetical protein